MVPTRFGLWALGAEAAGILKRDADEPITQQTWRFGRGTSCLDQTREIVTNPLQARRSRASELSGTAPGLKNESTPSCVRRCISAVEGRNSADTAKCHRRVRIPVGYASKFIITQAK